jgi:hypothetical protein
MYILIDLVTDKVLHRIEGPIPSQGDAVFFDDDPEPLTVVRVVHQILPPLAKSKIVRESTVQVYVTPMTQDDKNRDIMVWL